jgi:hypothetical protein
MAPPRAALVGAASLAVLASLHAGGPSAAAPSPPSGDWTTIAAPAGLRTSDTAITSWRGRTRLAVGDSLMVGASSRMRQRGFAVHAKVGLQFSAAPAIVRSYGRSLPGNLVIELGTNGTVSLAQCRSVVRAAGKNRRVFLVTNRVPRSWERSNNRILRSCNRSFTPSRVRIIDWHRASAGHREWFARDRVHLSTSGQRAFVRLIDRSVDRHGR